MTMRPRIGDLIYLEGSELKGVVKAVSNWSITVEWEDGDIKRIDLNEIYRR